MLRVTNNNLARTELHLETLRAKKHLRLGRDASWLSIRINDFVANLHIRHRNKSGWGCDEGVERDGLALPLGQHRDNVADVALLLRREP